MRMRAQGRRRHAEEVLPVREMLLRVRLDQTQVHLVDQRRGLQGVPARFVGHLGGGEAAQFIVDQGQKLVGSVWIAFLEGVQDSGDFVHQIKAAQHAQLRR